MSSVTTSDCELAATLRQANWPAEHLEECPACPACGGTGRNLLHDDVWDGSFLTAPGRWSLWRCTDCRSAYLDPRPDEASIGRAYANYYTHRAQPDWPAKRGLAAVKEALGNGYRNWRFGTKRHPASVLGIAVGFVAPGTRRQTDYVFRYLPQRPGRLLDLGCGSGDFLAIAKEAGWTVCGAEPDPTAAAVATKRGADVRLGGVEAWNDTPGLFDAVTMNHVVEHLHDPRAVLSKVFDLLRPGGFLYIDTPNIDAETYQSFGSNWRGLETPRHLVIFAHKALVDLLVQAGFGNIRHFRPPSPKPFLIEESERIAALSKVSVLNDSSTDQAREQLPAIARAEFITLTCERPQLPA